MSVLSDLFRHNRWANLAVVDACASLPDELLDASVPGTFGSTRATLLHLAYAEHRYVERLREQERSPFPEAFPGVDAIRAMLARSGDDLIELADQVDGTRAVDRDFGNKPWRIEHRVVLVQVIDHASEHRAHILTTLTTHGADAIHIDGWAWGIATGAMVPRG